MSVARSPAFPGVPLALASAALFGATPPLAKLLLNAVSPLLLAGLLYLGAGVGLAAYRLVNKAAASGSEPSPSSTRKPLKAARLRAMLPPGVCMFAGTEIP